MSREGKLSHLFSLSELKYENIGDVLKIEEASFENPWSKKSFLNEITQSISNNYIAKLNSIPINNIIAYISFRIVCSEMEILKIAVSKEYRRIGVATYMMDKCYEIALNKNAETAFLEVNKSNLKAINFYIKNGYERYGERAKYYKNEDALLLKKEL